MTGKQTIEQAALALWAQASPETQAQMSNLLTNILARKKRSEREALLYAIIHDLCAESKRLGFLAGIEAGSKFAPLVLNADNHRDHMA